MFFIINATINGSMKQKLTIIDSGHGFATPMLKGIWSNVSKCLDSPPQKMLYRKEALVILKAIENFKNFKKIKCKEPRCQDCAVEGCCGSLNSMYKRISNNLAKYNGELDELDFWKV